MSYCDELCCLCDRLGRHSVNPSGYHKVCDNHMQELFSSEIYKVPCTYCKVQIFISLPSCEYCLKQAPLALQTCQHNLCSHCLSPSCRLCELLQNLCQTCKMYSSEIVEAKCSHKICKICSSKFNGACGTCFEKYCKCRVPLSKMLQRYCRRYECEECYEQCRDCDNLRNKDLKRKCRYCHKINHLVKLPCEHESCQQCLKEYSSCPQCKIDENLRLKNHNYDIFRNESLVKMNSFEEQKIGGLAETQKNGRNRVFQDQILEKCIMCNNHSILTKRTTCPHPVCTGCLSKQCIVCESGSVVQKCKSCNKNNLVNNEKECTECSSNNRKQNRIDICSHCSMRGKLINRDCGHQCCMKCTKFLCNECNWKPEICCNCKGGYHLSRANACNHLICEFCKSEGCKTCSLAGFCSNCNREGATIKLSCECRFVCNNCSFLIMKGICILHQNDQLSRHNYHQPCRFTLLDPLLRRDCDKQFFCMYCRKGEKKIVRRVNKKNAKINTI